MLVRASFALTIAAGLALFACGTLLHIEPDGEPAADAGGAADAGDAGLDACPFDLSSSADNCGRCGRSCLGKACRDAMCEAQLLTQGYGAVRNIALDDEAVYFTSTDQAMLGRVEKDGGAGTELVPEGGLREPTSGLVADGAYVYASAYTAGSGAGVRRVTKVEGQQEPIDGCNTAWSVAVDATDVYWFTGICGGLPRMRRRGKEELDASATVTSLPDDAGFYPYAISGDTALDETDVYWMSTRQIKTLPKLGVQDGMPGTVFEPMAGDKDYLRALAVADRLYAVLGDRVIAVPKSGGAATVLADAAPNPSRARAAIVVVDGSVYFTRPDAGIVARVPAAGGAVETLAKGQAMPTGLALDAHYVYWSNAGDGTIWRVAR